MECFVPSRVGHFCDCGVPSVVPADAARSFLCNLTKLWVLKLVFTQNFKVVALKSERFGDLYEVREINEGHVYFMCVTFLVTYICMCVATINGPLHTGTNLSLFRLPPVP